MTRCRLLWQVAQKSGGFTGICIREAFREVYERGVTLWTLRSPETCNCASLEVGKELLNGWSPEQH
jgi:hypothetical protein